MNNAKRATDEGHKSTKGNTIVLNIPGFEEEVYITFPNRRLPVCAKCKGHFKTRDLCRMRKKHISPPWNTVYICINLDSSCIDDNNMLKQGSFAARNVGWKPYEFKDNFKILNKMPMCLDCKNKNYTGSSCRGGDNPHRHLPWSTVYVELSRVTGKSHSEMDTNYEAEEKSVREGELDLLDEKLQNKDAKQEDDSSKKDTNLVVPENNHLTKKMKNDNCQEGTPECDISQFDMKDIDKSRAFFVQISHSFYSIQWLDLDEEKALAFNAESQVRSRVPNDSLTGRHGNVDPSLSGHVARDGYMGQPYYQYYASHPHPSYGIQHHNSRHPYYHGMSYPPPPPQDQYGNFYNAMYNQSSPPMQSTDHNNEQYNNSANWHHYNQQWAPQNEGWQSQSRQSHSSYPPWQEHQYTQDNQYRNQESWSHGENVHETQAPNRERQYDMQHNRDHYRSQEHNSRYQQGDYDYHNSSRNSNQYEY